MLELRNIEKYYNPGTINEMCLFDKFNLTVDKGEFVSVVGSNGSGKTSMLNILCGSIPVDGGQILMNGEDITTKKEFKRNQKIGRVYQNPAMGTCPTMTILENMSLADNKGKFFGLGSGINKARKEYYREILSQLGLGLENKMDVKVGSLSGGQRQAIALLMSTMTPIDFLILDEHTAALDPKTAELIMELTGKIVEEKNGGKPVKVVANLPYYITTPIIMGLFENHVPMKSITVMVQKEVADRMQVGPGTKDYGALSLAVQFYAKPQIVANVPPNCFMPRPNVGSAVIRLTRHEEVPVQVDDEKLMFHIIRASFNQRRKTLANGLSNAPQVHLSKEEIQECIAELGEPLTIRGEALTLEQFAALSNIIGNRQKK